MFDESDLDKPLVLFFRNREIVHNEWSNDRPAKSETWHFGDDAFQVVAVHVFAEPRSGMTLFTTVAYGLNLPKGLRDATGAPFEISSEPKRIVCVEVVSRD